MTMPRSTSVTPGCADGDALERGAGEGELGEEGGGALDDEGDDLVWIADADGGGGPALAELAGGAGEGEAEMGAAEIDAEHVGLGCGVWGAAGGLAVAGGRFGLGACFGRRACFGLEVCCGVGMCGQELCLMRLRVTLDDLTAR